MPKCKTHSGREDTFLVSVIEVEKYPDAHPVSPKPCIPPPQSSVSMGCTVPFELCPDCYPTPKPSLWRRLVNALKALLLLTILAGCDSADRQEEARLNRIYNGPCQDIASLLATTAGSPNSLTCPNRQHRMRVEIKTSPSNEEIGALFFCECQHPDGGP
jgi:hypothetical protein